MNSLRNLIMERLDIFGTINDFAEFFGQTESNVRNVLSRSYIKKEDKPKRVVLRRFQTILKNAPNSWFANRK